MNMQPQWQIVPREMTPQMLAAAQAARDAGEDLAGQYRAALAAYETGASSAKSQPPQAVNTVSEERGEALLHDLEDCINSLVARSLFQHILAGDKRSSIAIMQDERMSEQDAHDLYDYCRKKWLGAKLAVVEVPITNLVGFINEAEEKAMPDGTERPRYLLRQGLSIVSCRPFRREDPMVFLTDKDEIEAKDIKQFWMVVQKP